MAAYCTCLEINDHAYCVYCTFAAFKHMSVMFVYLPQRAHLKYFDHRHVRYMWHQEIGSVLKLGGLDVGLTCRSIHNDYQGLSAEQRNNKWVITELMVAFRTARWQAGNCHTQMKLNPNSTILHP